MCHAEAPCAGLVDVRASRARIIQGADGSRRQLERDLHDGAQQRLLGVGMRLQLLQRLVGGPVEDVRLELGEAERELAQALVELRDLARKLNPPRLRESGLACAIDEFAGRTRLRLRLTCPSTRFAEVVESTVYLLVTEAVIHAGDHRGATAVVVLVVADDDGLRVEISDDSCRSDVVPHPALMALHDRFAAFDGDLRIEPGAAGELRVVGRLPSAWSATGLTP